MYSNMNKFIIIILCNIFLLRLVGMSPKPLLWQYHIVREVYKDLFLISVFTLSKTGNTDTTDHSLQSNVIERTYYMFIDIPGNKR